MSTENSESVQDLRAAIGGPAARWQRRAWNVATGSRSLVCSVVNRRGREEPGERTEAVRYFQHMIFEAYRKVRANRGAAGVDRESIEQFEADLKDNLYKLWNRMSSGS